jgi:VIT1/CCC1 family predicted Fe2+/Mn2+ transporter
MIQTTSLVTPPNYDTYGRTLAMIECASHHESDPSALAMIKAISTTLFKDLADFSRTQAASHMDRAERLDAKRRKQRLLNRMAMSTFGGLTLIVPMLIMVLDPSKLTTVVTTSVFTLVVGWVLAIWMDEADKKDMIAMTAAYAAVLVVFVGAGTNV